MLSQIPRQPVGSAAVPVRSIEPRRVPDLHHRGSVWVLCHIYLDLARTSFYAAVEPHSSMLSQGVGNGANGSIVKSPSLTASVRLLLEPSMLLIAPFVLVNGACEAFIFGDLHQLAVRNQTGFYMLR